MQLAATADLLLNTEVMREFGEAVIGDALFAALTSAHARTSAPYGGGFAPAGQRESGFMPKLATVIPAVAIRVVSPVKLPRAAKPQMPRRAKPYPPLRKDGMRISVEFPLLPFRGGDGKIMGVGAIMRDMTKRFEELRALREAAVGRA